jgi:nitrate reductase gamma subunit
MNGRFPFDVFLIIFFPFVMIATSIFVLPLLMPDHVHHHLAVVVALVLTAALAFGILIFWMRRRRRPNA